MTFRIFSRFFFSNQLNERVFLQIIYLAFNGYLAKEETVGLHHESDKASNLWEVYMQNHPTCLQKVHHRFAYIKEIRICLTVKIVSSASLTTVIPVYLSHLRSYKTETSFSVVKALNYSRNKTDYLICIHQIFFGLAEGLFDLVKFIEIQKVLGKQNLAEKKKKKKWMRCLYHTRTASSWLLLSM